MPGPIPKYNWDVIRQLAATGTPLPTLSKQFDINYQTLKSRARRESWRITETFGRARREPPNQKEKQNQRQTFEMVRRSAKDILENNGVASRLHLSGAIRKASAHLENMEKEKLIERHQALPSVTKAASTVHGWSEQQEEEKLRIAQINLNVLSMGPAALMALSEDQLDQLSEPPREIEP